MAALQEEAAQQAEKDWATLDDAEKRIFEDIAKGELLPCPPHFAFAIPATAVVGTIPGELCIYSMAGGTSFRFTDTDRAVPMAAMAHRTDGQDYR